MQVPAVDRSTKPIVVACDVNGTRLVRPRCSHASHISPCCVQFQAAACFAAFAITDDIAVKLNGSAFNIVLPAGQVALSFFAISFICLKRFGAYKITATKQFLQNNPNFEAEYTAQ